ncbi:Nibrin homolog [Linum perenne]
MVWSLSPVDPHSGEATCYMFRKGTYRVGRKGCDIIITKDKGVSRVHAEIVIDEMVSLSRLPGESNISSHVRIKDSSKYGTFVNKDREFSEKVHELSNKETTLKDGDVISFGTSNAIYRFSFVPFVFNVNCSQPLTIRDKVTSIGARSTTAFSDECTHVLTDPLMPVNGALIDAIVAKKPIILRSWVELVAEKNIASEIPSWSSLAEKIYFFKPFAASNIPTLTVEGASVQLVDSITRSKCLDGYTTILDSKQMYEFGDRLPALLEVAGAKAVFVEEYCSSSHDTDCGEKNRVICVTTKGSANKLDHVTELSSFSRVHEMDLLHVILSGHLDMSMLIRPTVHVSLSSTTDETIVADSETEGEAETATSVPAKASTSSEVAPKCEKIEDLAPFSTAKKLEDATCTVRSVHVGGSGMTAKITKVEYEDNENFDIIYSQQLVVRGSNPSAEARSTIEIGVPNFKCFRKKCMQSGNSFSNLVPFSRDPYKEASFDSAEIKESMKEEKKRKQLEAAAEDLFNNQRGKKKGMAGSISGLLNRTRR